MRPCPGKKKPAGEPAGCVSVFLFEGCLRLRAARPVRPGTGMVMAAHVVDESEHERTG
jgi:hypothetical protein